MKRVPALFVILAASITHVNAQFLATGDEIQYSCADNYSIVLQNVSPDYDIPTFASAGLVNPQYSYDPNTGQLDFSSIGLQGPKSFGSFVFDIYYQGAFLDQITIHILDCCLQPIQYDYLIVDQEYNQVFTGNTVVNAEILVLNYFLINSNTTFDGCTFYMANDARMNIPDGKMIDFYQTTVTKACEFCWDGIYADGQDTRIKFSNGELSGACNGFQLVNNVTFESLNSNYLANQLSIRGSNYYLPGDYGINNSRWNILGNLFDSQSNGVSAAMPHPLTNLYQPPQPYSCPSCVVGIELGNIVTEYLQIGESGQPRNTFTSLDMVGIAATISKVRIENNTFEDINGAIVAEFSNVIIGGMSAGHGNEFRVTTNNSNPPPQPPLRTSAISTRSSAQYIRNNEFYFSRIEIDYPNNDNVGPFNGTRFIDNSGFEVLSAVEGSMTPWDVVDVEFSRSNFNLAFDNAQFEFRNLKTTSLNNGLLVDNLLIRSNADDEAGNYRLKFINTPGARIGNNVFYYTPTGPGGSGVFVGKPCIYVEDAPTAQIKNHDFVWTKHGIYGTGDLSGITISCNTFTNTCIYGMKFYNAKLTDFGSATEGVENIFQFPSTTSSYPNITSYIQLLDCPETSPKYFAQFNYSIPGHTRNPWGSNGAYIDYATNSLTSNLQLIKAPNPASSALSDCSVLNKMDNEYEPPSKTQIFIYPNPTTGLINIQTRQRIVRAIVFDATRTKRMSLQHATVLNLNLPAGIYFLNCLFEDGSIHVEKILLLR